ncbi:TetR/AcrR family transcriptional regulator [Paenibacillus thailandensis]|uniref:TetR/AcrR family transcriptional regulator n=1 Tax=Paenibacillus thailandensis TaxID=393250 RepID=A0ABW5QQR1_9BACL
MDNQTREDLRVRRTHKLLYDALLGLMEKHPFETITVKQICDLAMVHRTTFYTHFNDKFDLLSHALRQIAEDEFNFAGGRLTPSESFQELFSIAAKHKKLFSQLLAEERDSLRNLLRREMGLGIKQHMIEIYSFEDNSIELQIAIEGYVGAVLGVLNWWIENNMPIDQENVFKKLHLFTDWNCHSNK